MAMRAWWEWRLLLSFSNEPNPGGSTLLGESITDIIKYTMGSFAKHYLVFVCH